MHASAMLNFEWFVKTYLGNFDHDNSTWIVEIGSQDVNGSLKQAIPPDLRYTGVDFVPGRNVDVVLDDAYQLPFESDSVDVIVSSSCFEHSEMFWLSFLEIIRCLKDKGLFYLQVPSNGSFHRFPVDCWRFYPDSGRALASWARRNSYNTTLLESYTSNQFDGEWNDFVAVFVKDEKFAQDFPNRILSIKKDITNGIVYGSNNFINYITQPEDVRKLPK